MKIRLLFLLVSITFFSNCKKNTTDTGDTASYINATIDGKNYSSKNVTVIRSTNTGDLLSFYSITPDSLMVGIQLRPASPSYEPGSYTFRPSGSQNAIVESFTIQDTNTTTLLKWTTTSESNVNHFEIERSSDGTLFSKLGNVQAAGNTTNRTNYVFTDNSNKNLQTYFYRLKIVNLDGSFSFSFTVVYNGDLNYLAYYGEGFLKYRGFNGKIDVTANDRTKRMVEGSFIFEYKDNNGQTKEVSNGKFKVFY